MQPEFDVVDSALPLEPKILDSKPPLADDTLQFEMFYVQCIAAGSYLVGHDGQAVLIDPLRDVDRYLKELDERKLKLKAVLLSHAHADYVSGHRELAERTGAVVVAGRKTGMSQYFAAMTGDIIGLSDKYRFKVMETPGHTPGCCTYVLEDAQAGKAIGAFTGDTLFVGSCGRPDLVAGMGFTQVQMATMMFHSLQTLVTTLPEETFVFPAHGAGSPCGKSLSDALFSTIGHELETNPALKIHEEQPFVEWLVAQAGSIGAPQYFASVVALNLAGAAHLQQEIDDVPTLSAEAFAAKVAAGTMVLDCRDASEFAPEHIVGSVNMPIGMHGGDLLSAIEGNFAIWVGTMVPVDAPLLVVPPAGRAGEVLMRLGRIGYSQRVAGVLNAPVAELAGCAGVTLVSTQRATSVAAPGGDGEWQTLDVRTGPEFRCPRKGHVKGAVNLPLGGTMEAFRAAARDTLDKDKKYVAYCSGSYRSAIAASLLRAAGFTCTDVYGGYDLTILANHRELTTLA